MEGEHGDPFVVRFGREMLTESEQTRLRHGIRRAIATPVIAEIAVDVDDATAVAGHHSRQREVREKCCAMHLNLDLPPPVVGLNFPERPDRAARPSVVYDESYGAQFVLSPHDRPLDILSLGHVPDDGETRGASIADLVRDSLDFRGGPCQDGDCRAVAGEPQPEVRTDPATSTANDRRFTCEHVFGHPPMFALPADALRADRCGRRAVAGERSVFAFGACLGDADRQFGRAPQTTKRPTIHCGRSRTADR